ncbi:MAG: AraC family transcriptional regulator [Clostridiales bacterium]|nr:AraC family transcriptional regulator [Clostridiales bacterium]
MRRIYEFVNADFVYHHSIDDRPVPEEYPMHAHDTHELFCFISGHGSYLVEGNPYPLRPGDLMLMRAGETHKLQIQSDRPYERRALSFHNGSIGHFDPDGRLLEPFLNRQLGRQNLYTAAELHGGCVAACFEKMEALAQEGEPGLVFQCFIYPILCELRSLFAGREHIPQPPVDLTAEIVEYINQHLCDELSLDSISSRFYISKTHLNRLFKQAVGSSVWEYVRIKRLMLCRNKIAAGIPAATASLECGFHDYSAFYRSYRKLFHAAPSQDHADLVGTNFISGFIK